MGKLDTLYKLFKAMHSKDILKGAADIKGYTGDTQILSLTGNFTYNDKTETVDIVNGEINLNLNSLKKDCSFSGPVELSYLSSHIAEEKHNLASVTTLIRIFTDLKISDTGTEKVLTASLNKMIEKMKKDYLKTPITSINLESSDNPKENIRNIFRAITKEFFELDYDEINMEAYLNKNYEIYDLAIIGTGNNNFKFKINFNY